MLLDLPNNTSPRVFQPKVHTMCYSFFQALATYPACLNTCKVAQRSFWWLLKALILYISIYRMFPSFVIILNEFMNKIQQDATVCRYLTQIYCTCFGCPSHPSSGVHKTETAASGTGHITYQCNVLPPTWHVRGRPKHWYVIWPVPEAAVTVLCTPDDGCDGQPKHVE